MSNKQKVDLATTTNITTTYVGEFAGKYIKASILNANTLSSGGFEIMPNVKFQSTLKRGTMSGLIKNAACDFDASGSITLTEKVITPKRLHVNLQVCKNDYRADWEAAAMGYSAWDSLPPLFSDFLMAFVSESVAEQTENNIWSGDESVDGEFDGIETQIALDAALPSANEVAGTTSSVANIVAELTKIVVAIPAAVYGKEGMKLYLPKNMIQNYIISQGGHYVAGATPFTGMGGAGTDGKGQQWYTNGSLTFAGLPIFMANGLTADTAFATYSSNFVFATGLLNDNQKVQLIDMEPLDGSDNVRVVMKYTAAATYKIVEDIVTYGITNGAN